MPLSVSLGSTAKDVTDWITASAAVIQAVGSILAIIGAALITNHDRKESTREATSRRVSALAVVIFRSEDALRKPYDQLHANGGLAYSDVFGNQHDKNARTIEQCLKILREIPVHELGDWDLVSAVVDMEEALVTGRRALDTIRAENKAAKFYPDMADIDLSKLIAPVNLAAEAAARIHQAAHTNSRQRKARRYRVKPAVVGKEDAGNL